MATAFSTANMRAQFPNIRSACAQLVDILRTVGPDQVVDIDNALCRESLDVIGAPCAFQAASTQPFPCLAQKLHTIAVKEPCKFLALPTMPPSESQGPWPNKPASSCQEHSQ